MCLNATFNAVSLITGMWRHFSLQHPLVWLRRACYIDTTDTGVSNSGLVMKKEQRAPNNLCIAIHMVSPCFHMDLTCVILPGQEQQQQQKTAGAILLVSNCILLPFSSAISAPHICNAALTAITQRVWVTHIGLFVSYLSGVAAVLTVENDKHINVTLCYPKQTQYHFWKKLANVSSNIRCACFADFTTNNKKRKK